MKIQDFIADYIARHKHPLNAGLHIIGVPLVVFAIFKLCLGQTAEGAICFVSGYLCQYLGHKAQGNEVGEVTLIKSIWRKLHQTGKQNADD
jgi:uncharacterized membrane protein YGL010W